MSDNSAFGFGKFVPGFDFLQNLAQTASKATPAGGGIPGMANWVAPTLSVEELDKRIQELKAVQFWLEQNGTALKATIQALEVQKMTLSTLQSMNVNMADLAQAFTAQAPQPTPAPAAAPADSAVRPDAQAAPEANATKASNAKTKRSSQKPSAEGHTPAGVDPMAWWGSLTQQFQDIANAAMKDVAAEALKAQSATSAATAAASADPAVAQPGKRTRTASRKPSSRATAKSPRTSTRKRAG